MGAYTALGVPPEIGLTLALIALAIALGAYFPGQKLGPIEIPRVLPEHANRAKIGGAIGFLVSLMGFVPLFPSPAPPQLNGTWVLVDRVEQSSMSAYIGAEHRFSLELDVAGDQVKGTAEKTSSNGVNVTPEMRSRLEIRGTLTGRTITASFTEEGQGRRKTDGKFQWELSPDFRRFEGTFRSTAAETRGTSRGHRLPD